MFNKLKQYKDMRQQAKSLQGQLSEESVEVSELGGGIKLKMDGNLNVQNVQIDPAILKPEESNKLQEGMKDAFNSAIKKVQRIMAAKMKESGGMDMFK